MSAFGRRFRPSLAITEEEALARAREECGRRGWPWTEPVRVRRRRRGYSVLTNAEARGGNVLVSIDGVTGEVLHANYAPR